MPRQNEFVKAKFALRVAYGNSVMSFASNLEKIKSRPHSPQSHWGDCVAGNKIGVKGGRQEGNFLGMENGKALTFFQKR